LTASVVAASVADPDPGSGIRNRFFWIPDPKPIF
jgi:hypothetical protein